MTAAGTTIPEAPPTRLAARSRGLTWRDWRFAGGFSAYSAFVLAVLTAGVVSALAAASPDLHEALHDRELDPDLLGWIAKALADASHRAQPVTQLVLDYGLSGFNLALAGLLVWLRPRDRTARLLATAMVGTAAVFNLQAYGVYEALPETGLVVSALHQAFHLVAAVCYVMALLRFPDGELVPRWSATRRLMLYLPVAAALTVLTVRIPATSRTVAILLVFGLVTPLVGVAAQAYRYRRSRAPLQRQQSRLLFWALVPALLLSVVVLTRGVTQSLSQPFAGRPLDVIPVAVFRVFQPVFAIIPVALFVGILRFRLWNIERVITRTLMYGTLAGFVSAVYVGVVVGVGRAIGTQGDNVALSIVATGVVAIAFEPVKSRVQRLANRLVLGRRATPYEVLSSFSERMAETLATDDLLDRMVRLLAEGTGARNAAVWLAVAGEARLTASWPAPPPDAHRVPLNGEELPDLGPVTAAVAVRHHGELLGALTVTTPGNVTLAPSEEKLLTDLAAQAGLVLRNVRLTAELLARLEELRASRQRLVTAQDEERRRLERDLHDGAQQELVALKVRLALVQRLADRGRPVGELLQQLNADAEAAIDNLRTLARGIYPPLLAADGLAAAVSAQASRAPFPVEVRAQGLGRFPREVEAAVYFCCLEALQNASKYADADRVVITLRREDGHVNFEVRDNGRGFEVDDCRPGAGTQNMADRIEALDGSLQIRSAVGAGTIVAGRVPCGMTDRSA